MWEWIKEKTIDLVDGIYQFLDHETNQWFAYTLIFLMILAFIYVCFESSM